MIGNIVTLEHAEKVLEKTRNTGSNMIAFCDENHDFHMISIEDLEKEIKQHKAQK